MASESPDAMAHAQCPEELALWDRGGITDVRHMLEWQKALRKSRSAIPNPIIDDEGDGQD